MNKYSRFFRSATSVAVVVLISLTLTACDECEEIDADALVDQVTTEEQVLIDQHGYFNLVGDCKTQEELACQNALPDSCDIACGSGNTCTQVELEQIQCNDVLEWSGLAPGYDAGYKWKRKCVEVPNG